MTMTMTMTLMTTTTTLMSLLWSNQSSYLREVRESQKVFSALVQSMERSHKALVASMEEQQREEEKRVETLVRELQEEVELLRGAGPDAPADEGSSQEGVRVSSSSSCSFSSSSTSFPLELLLSTEVGVPLRTEGLVHGCRRNRPLRGRHQAGAVGRDG